MAGRLFEFPDGSLYQVVASGDDNGGARTEIDITLPPGVLTQPPHIHRGQAETCTVMEGTLEALTGADWRAMAAGESIVIPPGTVHTVRNRSGENVRFVTTYQPSLGSEQYLERLYWLSAMNRIRARSISSLLYSSLLLDTHREDQVPARAGVRVGVRLMAGTARLLRFRIDR